MTIATRGRVRPCATRLPALSAAIATVLLAPVASADNVRGSYSPVYNWPLIPVHAVMMPDQRILTYGTTEAGVQTGNFIYDVWDINAGPTGGHVTLPNTSGTDIFCSSQVVLPESTGVFIAGGDNWNGTGTTNTGNNNANVFDYSSNTLTRTANMNRARWYSSSTVLLNGEVYVQGGSGGTDRPEIRARDGSFRLLTGANTSAFSFMYPRNFVAPDGRVFGYDSAGRMYFINTAGTGSVSAQGQFTGPTGDDSTAAMFAPGRILQFGGNSRGAVVIDVNGAAPTVTPSQSLATQRRLANATLLADGRVLATGGSSSWNQMTNVAYTADLWNPATGQWTVGASGARARLYHSVAMLLPDARVLVGGGGAPGPQVNTNVEIYTPPYLFTPAGDLAARPLVSAAPALVEVGETFPVDFAGASSVSRVTLVRTGSVTHSWNMEQRFQELTFATVGSRLMVQAPRRAVDAPPGSYLLFIIDGDGVPSVAPLVRVPVSPTPNPAVVPVITNPGNRADTFDRPVVLQLVATDPNGDAIGYGAGGLPPGLTLDSATGLITGQPTATGQFNVIVAASDGVNTGSASFVWTIDPPVIFGLDPPEPTVPVLAGAAVTFTVGSTNGVNARYRWSFDDGTPDSAWSESPSVTHTFARPGVYYVSVTATDDSGLLVGQTVTQVVHLSPTANAPAVSTNIAFEARSGSDARYWVVNQDNDSVSVFTANDNQRSAEIPVGAGPRSVALAPSGEVWVTNKHAATISVIDPGTLQVARTLVLPRASQPFGVAFAPGAGAAFVALEATGELLRVDPVTGTPTGAVAVGASPRQISISHDGREVYVARFITPPLPGENGASPDVAAGGGEVVVVDALTLGVVRTIRLRHSDALDSEVAGAGLPNYLGAAVLSPDGTQAWVPSKQDNIRRGTLRNGLNLNFQNTVRAITSRIDLAAGVEDAAARIDLDNASLASAAVFDPLGVYLFVALETSREVAVIDAHGGWEIFRFDVGRAPQGLAISADGRRLYVNNFMDRSVGVFDLGPLLDAGLADVPALATVAAVGSERLPAQVLLGKQLFYDARDPRLARDRYMSCATCHSDGGQDGRVWDLTGMGEGLRNTISLRGRAAGHGFLHWSNNFDEVQDFEGQIRGLAGGTGLMADAAYFAGTRSQPLGDAKAGQSAELDALAAYVASLNAFAPSPARNADGTLTADAVAGQGLFRTLNCAACHGGTAFTISAAANPANVGTLTPASGQRLGGPLTGIDVPTLRDVWATAPYLHDGSAATLEAAVRAHAGLSLTDGDVGRLAAYLRQIGSEEATAPTGIGTGLTGRYYNGTALAGSALLTRIEAVNFDWGSGRPGPTVPTDRFSVRWSGFVTVPVTGNYRFQTVSDDGVRLWVNGTALISNWTNHSAKTDTSAVVPLVAGQRYAIVMDYYENTGRSVARLRWLTPGVTTYVAIPASALYAQ